MHIKMVAIAVIWSRYGYIEMIKCLMIKTLLCYRLFSGVPILSFYDHLTAGG
jgi:hypothetical protein